MAFDRVCNWLEEYGGDCELYTIKEIHQKLTELAGHSLVYSEKSLKEKLKTHYKDHVYFTELPGCCLYILYEMKRKRKDIVIAAAKIIKAELRELDKSAETYPTLHEMEDIEKNK